MAGITNQRILIRKLGQKQGGMYMAFPVTIDAIRSKLEIDESTSILNEDFGIIDDTSLLRDGDIIYYGNPIQTKENEGTGLSTI